jgi:hypothetical protein
VSGTTTPVEGFHGIGFNPSSDRPGTGGVRRHSLVPSTTSSSPVTSKLRGVTDSSIREKSGENSGRWDW